MDASNKQATLNAHRYCMRSAPGKLLRRNSESNVKENIPVSQEVSVSVAAKEPAIPRPNPVYHHQNDITLTPEAIRLEQKRGHTKSTSISALTSPEATWLQQRPDSPEVPVILPYHLMRGQIKDLAAKALKKGYRQPLNFHYDHIDHTYDEWSLQKELSRYKYPGIVGPADMDDPVQVVTNNEGMAKFEMWYRVWIGMKDGYLVESWLPDIRNVMLHKEMTYRLIPVLRTEINRLQIEKSRVKVYTGEQIEMICRGIKERKVWIEDLEGCICHMRTFQMLLNELPEDAMMAKKHFRNFKPDLRDGVDLGFDDD
ncbi:hypothetical protein H072_11343 [Dactylellina haptotyla CBS 200.50]|uniref:Uncharacterized protein n=1 Tax=Dactylellina haptotyla (strain CBS 200.50) TaxID=1284197 RepID=S8B8G5_DACHA|nr:hypothetical protein H072_11343 [Dactylellina haptotyla CBS 200.50]